MSLFFIKCSEEEFSQTCFEWLESEIVDFINKKGTCNFLNSLKKGVIALSGGSTPIPIYK
jgi:6-phosphogluconolactonase/glucosamine-6-phosphate isomerase/deaminase